MEDWRNKVHELHSKERLIHKPRSGTLSYSGYPDQSSRGYNTVIYSLPEIRDCFFMRASEFLEKSVKSKVFEFLRLSCNFIPSFTEFVFFDRILEEIQVR
jgi:hypothetical protein